MGSFVFIIISIVITMFFAFFVFKHKINTTELALSLTVGVLLSVMVYNLGAYTKASDTEIWNGHVTDKYRDTVSCSHSYTCNCTTSTDSKGNSTTTCQTCYEHFQDYDWVVDTNVGSLKINRIDRQGEDEPPRFTKVKIGEPASVEHSFQNYVKAANYSLFQPHPEFAEKYKSVIPSYPRVYDYYRANRVFAIGITIPNIKEWNAKLSEKLITLGPKKQANINIFIVNSDKYSSDIFYGIQSAWYNGKKNDIIISVGVDPHTMETTWSKVGGWAEHEIFNVTLEQELIDMKNIEVDKTLEIVSATTVKYFKRLPMANFEYLKGEIEPSTFFMITAGIIIAFVNIAMSFLFAKYDFDIRNIFSRRKSYRRFR